MRNALPAKLKLQIACRYLATGDSLTSLQYIYRVPKCSISKFFPEVFDAIYETLKDYIEVKIQILILNEKTYLFPVLLLMYIK